MAYKQLKLWFDEDLAELLGNKILSVDSSYSKSILVKSISNKIQSLELKDRVEVFADELYISFNQDFKHSIETLLKIIGPENENETGMFKIYYWIMPIAKIVEKYGESDFEFSMMALEEITKRNTSEYAIRPFIMRNQNKTMKQIRKWSLNPNKHVRRLSSEGIRPRLPWTSKLKTFIEDPTPIIPVLTDLRNDKSKYVQKSVANCLNDIFKDNLDIGKKLVEFWLNASHSDETKWIVNHSIRNLIKRDDKWALNIKSKVKSDNKL